MRTPFKILFVLALLLAGLAGSAQCYNDFNFFVSNAGQVQFYNYSPFHDSITSASNEYLWDFGDNTTSTSDNYELFHTYTASDDYNVCLTVTNAAAACSTTVCKTVHVNMCQSAANFSYVQTGFGEYSFNAYLANTANSTLLWDFGDGSPTVSGTATPVHQFLSGGTYPISLIVSNSTWGCADTFVNSTVISLCNYPVGFYPDSTQITGATIGFKAVHPHPGYSYTWDFGDGGSASDTEVVHTYNSTNVFNVCLNVSDALTGCSASSCRDVSVELCGINAQMIIAANPDKQVTFGVYTNSIDSPYTYAWSFPDATPSSSGESDVTVVYPAYGTYEACLHITTTGGCTDTICQPFTIRQPVYYIWGNVYKGNEPSCATVYLIKEDAPGHLVAVDSVIMQDSTGLGNCFGRYGFYNVPAGVYYVKAALQSIDPDYADYLPAYYGDELNWADATPVEIINAAAFPDIHLVAGHNPGGPGFIGGYVSEGAGLVAGGGGHPESRSVGDPLAHIQINLLTGAGLPVAYTYTDASGHYQFSGLAYGDYQVYAEQPGKTPVPATVAISAEHPSNSNVNVSINSTSAVTGVEALDNIAISGVFPNPVVNMLGVSISVKHTVDGTLKLINMLGETETERSVQLSGGDNHLKIDMSNFAAGVYQLIIQTSGSRFIYKIMKQ